MKIITLTSLFLSLNLCAAEKFTIFKFDPSEKSFQQVGSPLLLAKRTIIEKEYHEGRDKTLWVENYDEVDGKPFNALLVGVLDPKAFLAGIKRRKFQRRLSIAESSAARRIAFLNQSS